MTHIRSVRALATLLLLYHTARMLTSTRFDPHSGRKSQRIGSCHSLMSNAAKCRPIKIDCSTWGDNLLQDAKLCLWKWPKCVMWNVFLFLLQLWGGLGARCRPLTALNPGVLYPTKTCANSPNFHHYWHLWIQVLGTRHRSFKTSEAPQNWRWTKTSEFPDPQGKVSFTTTIFMVDQLGPRREKSEVNGTEAKSWIKNTQMPATLLTITLLNQRPRMATSKDADHFWFFRSFLSETQTRKAAQE